MRYIIIALLVLTISCGTRKKETTLLQHDISAGVTIDATQKATITESTGAVRTQYKTAEEKYTATKQSGTYSPVNPDKPMTVIDAQGNATTIYNGKWETGTEKSRSEKKTTENNQAKDSTQSTTNMSGTYKENADIKASGKEKTKDTQRDYSLWPALLFAGMLCILFWYFAIKRRKNEREEN